MRVVAPPTLLPPEVERLGVTPFTDMRAGLAGCDIIMMLRLQTERMRGSFVPSVREYFALYGLDRDDAAYVLGTFPIVRRQDEKAFNRYRTKEMVLAYMNALAAGDTQTDVAV